MDTSNNTDLIKIKQEGYNLAMKPFAIIAEKITTGKRVCVTQTLSECCHLLQQLGFNDASEIELWAFYENGYEVLVDTSLYSREELSHKTNSPVIFDYQDAFVSMHYFYWLSDNEIEKNEQELVMSEETSFP